MCPLGLFCVNRRPGASVRQVLGAPKFANRRAAVGANSGAISLVFVERHLTSILFHLTSRLFSLSMPILSMIEEDLTKNADSWE